MYHPHHHSDSGSGEESDAEHHSLKDRHSCTDIPCCIIFAVFLALFAVLYGYILNQTGGGLGRLAQGVDSDLRACGADKGVENKPFLFWCRGGGSNASLAALNFGRAVCVQTCPTSVTGYEAVPECGAAASSSDGTASSSTEAYATTPQMGAYCVPDLQKYANAAQTMMGAELGGMGPRVELFLGSLSTCWPVVLFSLALALVLGYIHLFLLQWCAKPMIWLSILLSIAGLAGLGAFFWLDPYTPDSRLPKHMPWSGESGDENQEENIYKGAAIVCWVLAGLALCTACCLRSSVHVAAEAAEVACEAIFEMPTMLLLPATKAVLKAFLAGALLYGFLLLWSLGSIEVQEPAALHDALSNGSLSGWHPSALTNSSAGSVPHVTHTLQQKWLLLFYMLTAYWILSFVTALYQFVVAYTIATYYFAPPEHDESGHPTDEKDVEGCCTMLEGLHVGLCCHTGSLAFGSFIIAMFHVIQKIIEYAELKNKEAGDNKLVACILCMCSCCINMMKNVVGFINKNAYIDMAITSNNFCEAAKRSLQTIIEIGSAMAILNGATYVFTIFGTLFITIACSLLVYYATGFNPFADATSSLYVADPLAAVVVASFIAFLVAMTFMDIFDMASDTLLYCYGSDMQKNSHDGHHVPESLKELVNNNEHDNAREVRSPRK